MKKILCLLGILMSAGAVPAAEVVENFDWGSGVSGREAVTNGSDISGMPVSDYGTNTWTMYGVSSLNSAAKFSGLEGASNGTVTISGTGTVLCTAYTNFGGIVTATAVGTYTPDAAGSQSTKRLCIGFQTAGVAALMGAGSYDSVQGDINSFGLVFLRAKINGTNYLSAVTNNFASFTSGDTVRMVLSVNKSSKFATLITSTSLGSVTNTLNFSAASSVNLGEFAVNVRYGTAVLDSISITPPPATLDLTDNFDWGSGVSGRESVTNGQTINGQTVFEYGTNTWAVSGSSAADAAANFSGADGIGNGTVVLTGTNTILRVPYVANWAGEAVTATAIGTFTPGVSGTRRFAMGFQKSSAPDSTILGAGNYDSVVADINNSGVITLKVRFFDTVNVDYNPAVVNSFASFTPGDLVKHQLTLDNANKKAVLVTTTSLGTVTNVTDFSAATRTLDLGFFAVNGRTGSTIGLDSVSVTHSLAIANTNKLGVSVLFRNNMVLQRDMDVPMWGVAATGSVITVKLDGTDVGTATTDSNGRWLARIGSHANDGGLPHTILISCPGEPDIQIDEVVFGDVYLASGQSNMRHRMSQDSIIGYAEELANANAYPLIRQVAVLEKASATEWTDPQLDSSWSKCSTSSIPEFSATGYFFAKNVYLKTGVPVGLIVSAWGGQEIDRFLNPSGVAAVPELSGMLQYQEQGGITNFYDIYNAMVAPLIPYGMRGMIWYQGEENANMHDGDIYQYKMKALMRGWRQKWESGDFPVYYVQLANLASTSNDKQITWPEIRDAQYRALSETNSGMVVTIDVGDDGNIHPGNKFDTGLRLSRWALAKDLGYDLVCSGPLYRSSMIEGAQIRILFDGTEDGLMTGLKTGTNAVVESAGALQNFEIAGSNKVFTAATAVIDRDTVVVSNEAVPVPCYVRYCYTNAPAGANKLYNTAGLPASPFRTDGSYHLDVISGSGTSTGLDCGAQAVITADTPASGKVFDRWIGAAAEIDNLNASTATVTMPSHSLYLLATYRDEAAPVYTLTVNNGFGSGTSRSNSILNITADPPEGQLFDHWTGDTQTVVNVYASSTTLRMPAGNVTVTAVCRTAGSTGDGISDVWRAAWFGGDGTATNSESAANADPDNDGASNFQEYKAGTSPVEAQSVLRLGKAVSGRDMTLSFPSTAGRRYRLETAGSLIAPEWTTVLYNIVGDGKQKQTRFDMGASSNRFYRLRLITE